MKRLLVLTLLLFACFSVSAQQSAGIDNALLLDYYQNQRFAEAYNYLKTVYPEPVTDTKALANLAYTSRMAGKLADAEGYYQRVYDKDSTNIAILFNLGSINVSRGNNLRALTYYKKILLKDSANFNVYKQLASLSQNLFDTVTYNKYLVKANTINPQEPDVAYDLGRLYIVFKKYDKAAVVFDKAIQADTANLVLLKGKAEVTFLQKKYPETVNNCIKLMQSGEKGSAIINWLAISYFKLRQYKLCIAAFSQLSGNMQNESTFYYQAMCYKSLNDYPNSIVYLQKALVDGITPNAADYYTEIADAYGSLNQLKKSVTAYQKSLQFKEAPLTYYSLANLYDVKLLDKKLALKYYKKYLDSKPVPDQEQKYIDYAKIRIPELGTK